MSEEQHQRGAEVEPTEYVEDSRSRYDVTAHNIDLARSSKVDDLSGLRRRIEVESTAEPWRPQQIHDKDIIMRPECRAKEEEMHEQRHPRVAGEERPTPPPPQHDEAYLCACGFRSLDRRERQTGNCLVCGAQIAQSVMEKDKQP